MTGYCIKRTTDGLYSTGGLSPIFKKTGKIWKRMGDVRSHLTQIRAQSEYYKSIYHKHKDPQFSDWKDYSVGQIYKYCVIVTLSETESIDIMKEIFIKEL